LPALRERRSGADGFSVPDATSGVSWRDRDSVFLGTDFGAGSQTDSGYPRDVRIWQRGTPLAEAEKIFAGARADVSSRASRWIDHNGYREFIVQATSFYTFNYFLYGDGTTSPLELPEDADIVSLIDDQLLVMLKTDWERNGQQLPQGALIAAGVDAFVTGEGSVELLFEPTSRASLAGVSRTAGTVVLDILDNVVSRLELVERRDGGWRQRALDVPGPGAIGILSTELESDRFYFSYTGFLTPPSIYEADAARGTSTAIRTQPAFFDARGMNVEQLSTTSADGTTIPYFVVTPPGFEANGTNPTLLYGYGGFEVSMTPGYSATIGTAWLERGGVYVLANIRGGGEFGPAWHQSALKANRQRAYDDFIAVAEDLIARDITAPEHLGISGGSNGGLLVGAVFVQRPDLFNAVVCQVPLLDMQRYHRLLAGASWMAEYGDPDQPDEWAYISRYSPYQNVAAEADYPQVYFFTSTRDDRVHPGHARKMVARMLDQGHDVLYYENIEGGHGGAANQNQRALNDALAYTYLHARLNPDAGD
jgi:prolyl oligopeptidase